MNNSIIYLSAAILILASPVYAQTVNHAGNFGLTVPFGPGYDYNDIKVSRVIDGDTLQLENGERVQLIGVDAPESRTSGKAKADSHKAGQPLRITKIQGRKSAKFLKDLVEGRKVRLEFDVKDKDQYGQLLAYVWMRVPAELLAGLVIKHEYPEEWEVQEKPEFCPDCHHPHYIFLNATVIKAGYASPKFNPPNVKYAPLFQKLDQAAREEKRGLWADQAPENPD